MKWVSQHIFSSGSRQEVDSNWYPESEEPIKSREKHYCVVHTNQERICTNSCTNRYYLFSSAQTLKCNKCLSGEGWDECMEEEVTCYLGFDRSADLLEESSLNGVKTKKLNT